MVIFIIGFASRTSKSVVQTIIMAQNASLVQVHHLKWNAALMGNARFLSIQFYTNLLAFSPDENTFHFRALEPEKAMENVSVIQATVVNFVSSALVDFTILIETTRKFFALLAIVHAKMFAHKPGRKVAWLAMTDGSWIPNKDAVT